MFDTFAVSKFVINFGIQIVTTIDMGFYKHVRAHLAVGIQKHLDGTVTTPGTYLTGHKGSCNMKKACVIYNAGSVDILM